MHPDEIARLIQAQEIQALSEAMDDLPGTVLIELLNETWHTLHEDIVFRLGLIGDPQATEAILRLALQPPAYLADWGNTQECQRKCAFALARLGTEASRQALQVLAGSTDPDLQAYGEEGLAHWPLPWQRR